MNKHGNCPPPGAAAQPIGFRFVFADLNNPKNFAVQAALDPKRFIGRPDHECCVSYGLSMFVDLWSLQDKAKRVVRTVPNFLKKVGDHYACVAIGKGDARCTSASSCGHFTLFEYAHFDPKSAVAEHGPL